MGGVGRLPFSNHHHPSHHYHNNNINIAAAAAAVTENEQQQQQDAGDQCIVREQDRFMPIANVIRIMRKILPPHAKISDEAKETIQECVSEYISFITGEANDRCQREQRKTITAEDVLWAMSKLGFDDYIEPLTLYLHRYREFDTNGGGGGGGSSGVVGGGTTTLQQQHSVLMFKRTAAAAAAVDPPPVGVLQQQQHTNIMYPPPAAAASGHHGPISAFHLHPASAAYGSSSMPMPTIGFVGGGLHRPHHHQRRRHPSNSNGGGGASTSQAHDQAPIN